MNPLHDHTHGRTGKGRSRNWSGPWPRTPTRVAGIGLVRLYQLTLSGFIGNTCRHLPTCSEYAYEAIARHGLWAGFWLSLFRVARCGPGGTCGIDNVPEVLGRHFAWWAPWRYRLAGKKRNSAGA
ncbi:membrane protein insertion efficiency factor YidD [Manganibacter manganicus]|uniref:Putative membrane protein insertion efficiency factor n=1 Tax=Manganibacter manganicus TaxID=1873176 RepID=A0A1V8RRL9_9HYPH|nr:membrane protein insertion efficiency factor YidD [Pseudaminobacter manganicus]OQM75805.1 membrane protein insertion efficiency factor YidD [Pseudaminobacter manganicus]